MQLPPFALERFFAKHEFSVKHLACASDPEPLTIREVVALEPGAEERLLTLRLGYSETMGSPELRSAIAGLYSSVTADDVLVQAGGEEPIFTFFNVALQPGDHVIAHFPGYQALSEVARAVGADVSKWPAHEEDGWQVDPQALESLRTPKTRAIVLNSPHNPTGALISRDRLDATIAFARRHGLWIFSDEVYRGLEHAGPSARRPGAVDLYERAVSLGAGAKTYGLAGLRIGWVASKDRDLLARMAAFKDYLTICSATPSEMLAAIGLRHAETLAERSRAIVTANAQRFAEIVARFGDRLSWVPPEGGTTAFPRLLAGEVEPWCERLLADRGVLLLPGPLFGWPGPHFRLGLGRKSFGAAMDELEGWLTN